MVGPTSQLLLALPVDPHCAPAEGLEPTVSYGPLQGGAQLYMLPHVTEQTRALPHVALMHDPTISAEGNKFLFTGFQPQGARLGALLLGALFSHETQHVPCSPPGSKAQACPDVPQPVLCS